MFVNSDIIVILIFQRQIKDVNIDITLVNQISKHISLSLSLFKHNLRKIYKN